MKNNKIIQILQKMPFQTLPESFFKKGKRQQ